MALRTQVILGMPYLSWLPVVVATSGINIPHRHASIVKHARDLRADRRSVWTSLTNPF